MKPGILLTKNRAWHLFSIWERSRRNQLFKIGALPFMVFCLSLPFSWVVNAYDIPIVNPGFEEGKTGWDIRYTPGTICSFSLDSNSFSGILAAKIVIASSGGYCNLANTQSAPVSLTGKYKLSLSLKVSGSPVSIKLAVWRAYDSLTFPHEPVKSTSLYSLSSDYKLYELEDIAFSAGEYVRLEIGMEGGTSEMWLDNIDMALTECDLKGDVNGDCLVDIADVILSLRVISNQGLSDVRNDFIGSTADVNNDNKIGVEEVIYTLREIAGLYFDKVGKWNGTLTGYQGTGQLQNMTLMTDNHVLGYIKYFPSIGGTITLIIDSLYFISRDSFDITCAGEAYYLLPPHPYRYSKFTLKMNGSLTSNTQASGTYDISFYEEDWMNDLGTWSATKGEISCFTDDECWVDQYCSKDDGDCSGQGRCWTIMFDIGCPDIWDPVCGCDGVTYGNICEATRQGVSVAYEGFCIPNLESGK
jgi:hypothetical protein